MGSIAQQHRQINQPKMKLPHLPGGPPAYPCLRGSSTEGFWRSNSMMFIVLCSSQNLSAAQGPEQLRLMLRRFHFQQVPFIAALVEADALLRETDQLKFGRLQLEIVHVELAVHAAGVEQELVGRNGEQGPGQREQGPCCSMQQKINITAPQRIYRLPLTQSTPSLDVLTQNGGIYSKLKYQLLKILLFERQKEQCT